MSYNLNKLDRSKKFNWQQSSQFWANISKEERNVLLVKILYAKFYQLTSDKKALYCWLFILKRLIKSFTHHTTNFERSLTSFSQFFYKKIRELQGFIKLLRLKVPDLFNLNVLKKASRELFVSSWNSITLFNFDDSENEGNNLFNQNFELYFSKDLDQFNEFLEIKENFGINIKFDKALLKDFDIYLFQLYLRLHELEEIMQWFNWGAFRLDIDHSPYKFNKGKALTSLLKDISVHGYTYWHKNYFNTSSSVSFNKFKLKKKWRFWREFKKCLLFEKSHVFIKFKWLFNHKRVLNHQYINSYSIRLQSKLKKIYNKKISKTRLFNYLFNLEYRVDILAMRLFNIKTIKWVWILLYFGYLTINFNKKNKNYIVQVGDLIFGWFLLKNYKLFNKLRKRFYKPRKIYSFLEYEAHINSFICLSLPIKYTNTLSNDDRLISKRFIKYTYLKTY